MLSHPSDITVFVSTFLRESQSLFSKRWIQSSGRTWTSKSICLSQSSNLRSLVPKDKPLRSAWWSASLWCVARPASAISATFLMSCLLDARNLFVTCALAGDKRSAGRACKAITAAAAGAATWIARTWAAGGARQIPATEPMSTTRSA